MISASVVGSGSVQASVSGSSPVYVSSGETNPLYVSVYSIGQSQSSGSLTLTGGSSSQAAGYLAAIAPEKPPEMVWLSTRLESGTFGISVRSSTGYFSVLWWDGTVQGFGTGNATQYVSATRSVPTSGSYSRSSPKSVYVWPSVSASSAVQVGSFTGFSCSAKKVTALSASDCASLTSLSCDSNGMEYLDISRCTAMTSLVCHGNRLRSLDVSDSLSLGSLYCQSNFLESLDVTKNTFLEVLQCNTNSITSLNLSYSSALKSLFCHDNLLSSLNITPCPLVTALNCSGNDITSLRARNASFANQYGANIENNLLLSSALDQFYTDIATAPAGQAPAIYVAGNPGTSSDNPFYATSKGYVVYGT